MHNGVRSPLGQGVSRSSSRGDVLATPVGRVPQANLARTYMATLLYVDDEVTIGRVVSRFFTRRGDVVLLAHSIAEAREHLEREDPAVLFIDVWIGTESGFELLSWINDTHPHLIERVTFVTGEDVGGTDPARLSRTLGRPFIQKPFELSRLAESLDDAGRRVQS